MSQTFVATPKQQAQKSSPEHCIPRWEDEGGSPCYQESPQKPSAGPIQLIRRLQSDHARLDRSISKLAKAPYVCSLEMRSLKTRRLRMKDELQNLQRRSSL